MAHFAIFAKKLTFNRVNQIAFNEMDVIKSSIGFFLKAWVVEMT